MYVHVFVDMLYWNDNKILTGNIPYHHLSRDEQVLFALFKGVPPKRSDEVAVTVHRWRFIEWCWSPAKGAEARPSSDEIVAFTEKDLAKIMTSKDLAESTAALVM